MKKSAILTLALFASVVSFGQTKRIAHLSHSGSNETFTVTGSGNFGLAPEARKEREKRRMDTMATRIDTLIKNGADSLRKAVVAPEKKSSKKKATPTKKS